MVKAYKVKLATIDVDTTSENGETFAVEVFFGRPSFKPDYARISFEYARYTGKYRQTIGAYGYAYARIHSMKRVTPSALIKELKAFMEDPSYVVPKEKIAYAFKAIEQRTSANLNAEQVAEFVEKWGNATLADNLSTNDVIVTN